MQSLFFGSSASTHSRIYAFTVKRLLLVLPHLRIYASTHLRFRALPLFTLALSLLLVSPLPASAEDDLRAYQHGIDIVKRTDGSYLLIWSSAGNPPRVSSDDWTHDVYYSSVVPSNPSLKAVPIISKPESQEPTSAAISRDGHIMITCEDGWNVENDVGQRWGIYDENLKPVKPYPNLIKDGGHSGHVAAVGNTFVVFWSDGWDESVPGGDAIGVGKHVRLSTFSSTGARMGSLDVQVSARTRDWWPLVAGSDSRALLVWQRYAPGGRYVDLMYAVYDPAGNRLAKGATRLTEKVSHYTYDVQYYPAIDRFLVAGSYKEGGGFAFLIDGAGEIAARNLSTLPVVRESKPARSDRGTHSLAVYPRYPKGAFVLKLGPSTIELNQIIEDDYEWQHMGTAGVFADEGSVYFASLSNRGIVHRRLPLDKAALGLSSPRKSP